MVSEVETGRRTPASRWLMRLGVAMQFVVVALAAAGAWIGWRGLDHSFRRGVIAAAGVSAEEWAGRFELLTHILTREELAKLVAEKRALKHELSSETAVGVMFSPLAAAPPRQEWRRRALRELQRGREEWWEFLAEDLEGGLNYACPVRWTEGCQGCHAGARPGAIAGFLSYHHPAPRMSALLVMRRGELFQRQGLTLLVSSAALWLIVAVAVHQTRRIEARADTLLREVRASEQKLRAFLDNALVGAYLFQGDRILFVNRRACEILQYSPEELLTGVRMRDVVASEDREMVGEQVRLRLNGEVEALRYEYTAIRKDGTRIPVEAFGSRVMLPSGPAIQGMFIDRSDRQAAERALDAAYRAVVGLPGRDLFAAAVESVASLLNVAVVFVSRLAGAELEIVASHNMPPGLVRVPLAGTPCEQVVLRRQSLEVVARLVDTFPGAARWAGFVPEFFAGMPLFDGEGEVLGVLAVVDPVPRELSKVERQIVEMHAVRLGRELERLRQEEHGRELEQRLLQSQKLEALGVLAGGIAHNFNNVLAGITSTAEVLIRTLPAGPERARAENLVALARRGGDVVQKILAFARSEVPAPRPVDVNAVVTETIGLARHLLGPQVTLLPDLCPHLPTVDGDAGQLDQAVVNLLINARDAMPQGGKVVVHTRPGPEPGTVTIEVEDEGCGIAPEILPHVFEPFFTTKPTGQGSGLGLSIVYRTVTAHGGAVRVVSQRGTGTRITITLPAGKLPAAASPEPLAREEEPTLTVLVVDDEPVILQSLTEILTMEGHRVLGTTSPRAALELWQREAERVDVALLDIAMPELNGVELARKLRAVRPHLPVVFSSGHSTQTLGDDFQGDPFVAFLQKPYGSRELFETLRRVVLGRV